MLVSLPNPLINGTTAFGSEVKANDDSIVAVVNGGIDNDNMRTGADAAGKGLTTDKYADASITTAKIADGNVTAVKLADDSTLGNGANLSELYSGSGSDAAGGYPQTNVIAARKQQGGKTIWFYISIPVASVGTDFLLDDSIDWRTRLIFLVSEFTGGSAVRDSIPGGVPNDNSISYPFWTAGPVVGTGGNGGLFFAENGQATGAASTPGLELTFGLGGTAATARFYARSTDGALMIRATAIGSVSAQFNAMVACSPHLGTT